MLTSKRGHRNRDGITRRRVLPTGAALISLVAFGHVMNPASGAAQEKTPATTVVPPPPAGVLADPVKPASAISGPKAPPAIAATDLPPVDKANPVAVAVDEARRSGRRVEVTAARTETVTTYANPDGTLTTEIAGGPVRVRQGAGFVPVDPTLVSVGGAIAPRAAKGSVKFSSGGGAGGELASLASGTSRLALKWPGVLPAPTLASNTATYRDVAPGQDLVVKATTTGFESFVVLRSAPRAAPVIRIPVALQNLSLTQDVGGALRLASGGGTKDIVVPSLVMFSAARDARADEPTQVRTVAATVEQGVGGTELVLRPDFAFLSDPATVYPVTIDPAGTLTSSLSNHVDSSFPTTNYDSSDQLKVGTWNGGAQRTRSFIRFDASQIKGKVVTGATLEAYEYWSYSCSAGALWVDGAGTLNPGMTWNNQPSMDGQHWYNGSFAGRSDCAPNAPAGYKQMNITGLVQQWSSNGNAGPEHLALRAANEYDNNQWKKFYSVNTSTPPFISVTYENPQLPGPPQNVQAAPGNGQATITWAAPTNLGQPPLTGYNIYTYVLSGGTWVLARADTACGTCISKVVTGLTNGATYFTYVYSVNPQLGGYGSTPASYVPGLPAPPPSATAAGRNVSATVSWTASPVNNGLPIQAYGVFAYHYPSYAYANSYTPVCATCLAATVTGLTNGQQYAFFVYAHNGVAWSSTGTGTNAVTPAPTVPNAPTNVVAAPANASATVTWTAPTDNGGSAIDANFVFAYTHPALAFITHAQVCPTCTSATVTGLTNGQAYQFLAFARNGVGNGEYTWSNVITVGAGPPPTTSTTLPPSSTTSTSSTTSSTTTTTTVASAPNPPSQLDGVAGRRSMNLVWQKPAPGPAVTGYRVTIVNGPACNPSPCTGLEVNNPDTPLTVVEHLQPASSYTFQVVAINGAESSTPSNNFTKSTEADVPDAPTGLTAAAGPDEFEVSLSWTAPANNGAPIDEYNVISQPPCGCEGQLGITSTSTVVRGVPFGAPGYSFTVVAVNRVGPSEASAATSPISPFSGTKVMSWNVEHFRASSDVDAFAGAIVRSGAEVVGLQEVEVAQAAAIRDALISATGQPWGVHQFQTNAILTPLSVENVGGWPFANEPARGFIRAVIIDDRSGAKIHFYDAHLGLLQGDPPPRTIQAEQIRQQVATDLDAAATAGVPFRAIVVGDFNEPGVSDDHEIFDDPAVQVLDPNTLATDPDRFYDVWEILGLPQPDDPDPARRDDSFTLYNPAPPTNPARIDYVLVGRQSKLTPNAGEASVDKQAGLLSDHRPVIAGLTIHG